MARFEIPWLALSQKIIPSWHLVKKAYYGLRELNIDTYDVVCILFMIEYMHFDDIQIKRYIDNRNLSISQFIGEYEFEWGK